MGVDAILYRVHQQGTSPRRRSLERLGSVDDADYVIARLPATHPGRFTSRIDPCGDALVHNEEFTDLIEDLVIIHEAADLKSRPVLTDLMDLVRPHAGERGIELHLCGD